MAEPYIAEIRIGGWNFAPQGWASCNGSTLAISQNEALFNLIGTTYGGDGQTTFNLPNLLGRVPIHQGTDSFGNGYVIGQFGGAESVTVEVNQLPIHNHSAQVSGTVGNTSDPTGHFIATAPLALGNTYVAPSTIVDMGAAIPLSGGSGQPHDNIQPFQAVNYIISLFGVFPSQG